MENPTALKEEIICPLCYSVFNNPRTLQCLHSYCEDCLYRLHQSKLFADTIDCPECRAVTHLEEEGIHGLKVNFKLKRIVEILSSEEKREISRQLVSRPVPAPRTLPRPRTSSSPHCEQHPEKQLEYYCTQCRVLICSQCMLDSHRFHRDPISAQDALKEKLCSLRSSGPLTESLLSKGDAVLRNMQLEKDALWRSVETDVSNAQAYFQKIRSLLDEREMEACKSIEARATKHQARIDKQKKVVQSSINDVQRSRATIEHVIEKRSNDVKVLIEERQITQKLDTQTQHLTLLIEKSKEKPRTTYRSPFVPDPNFEAQCKIVGLPTETNTSLTARHTFVGSFTPSGTRSNATRVKGDGVELSKSLEGSPNLGTFEHKKFIGNLSDLSLGREVDGVTIITPSAMVTSAGILGPTHHTQNDAHPCGVCVGNSNTLVVTDSKHHLFSILTPTGKFLHSMHTEGNRDGQLVEPTAVACDVHGKILVVDKGQPPRVQLFSDSGNFLSKFKVKSLSFCCHLGEPLGLVALDDRTVLISDSEKSCVHIYDEDGKYQGKFGDSEVNTKQPAGMAIDSRGNVFIADRGNHCIWIYTCGGQYVSKTGKHGSAPGELNYPYGVAIDKKGNIFVSESGNHRISMFRPGGKFVRCFGKKGSEPGMFLYPRHLCVDSQGRLVVADEQNHRLQIFNIADKFD